MTCTTYTNKQTNRRYRLSGIYYIFICNCTFVLTYIIIYIHTRMWVHHSAFAYASANVSAYVSAYVSVYVSVCASASVCTDGMVSYCIVWYGMAWYGVVRWMFGWMDGWTDGWMDGCMVVRMDGWMDGCMDIWMHCIGIYYKKSMAHRNIFEMQKPWAFEVVRWINEWGNGGWDANDFAWKNPCTSEWMNQWIGEPMKQWIN